MFVLKVQCTECVSEFASTKVGLCVRFYWEQPLPSKWAGQQSAMTPPSIRTNVLRQMRPGGARNGAEA